MLYARPSYILVFTVFVYAVSGANDSEWDSYSWMGTDSVCFSVWVSTFQMNLLPSP